MLNNPWIAMVITLILCVIWMRFINFLASKKVLDSGISRKLIHIDTGPLFLLCWLLFPDQEISRYLAAIVPFLIVIQVLFVGLGIIKDYTSVQSMARSGKRRELLRGPFFYGMVFVVLTIFFWNKIDAVIALMILCGGDGAADLIGSRVNSPVLPWTKKKTIIGSLSMIIVGTLLSFFMILILRNQIPTEIGTTELLLKVTLITFVAAIVESVTPSDYDNLSVPAVSLLLSMLFF